MKWIKYTVIITFLSCTYACSDFLKESSQDEVRPSTLEDLKQLMLYEAYPRNSYFIQHLDFLTDDVESAWPKREDQKEILNSYAPIFTWEVNMDEKVDMNYWENYYKRIKGCNVVLDMVDDMTGTETDRENLRGQALALRSYYYLMLVNLYGAPYNAEGVNPNTSLGVPLVLTSDVTDVYPERATLVEVYEQIEKDLLQAEPLMEKYGTENDVYRVTDCFVYAVLARMYLYQENWEKVIEYSEKVLAKRNRLVALKDAITVNWGMITIDETKKVYDVNSVENIWSYSSKGEYESLFPAIGFEAPPAYCASSELRNLYEYDNTNTDNYGDLRPLCFYQAVCISGDIYNPPIITGPYYGLKGNSTMSWNSNKGIRVAELYLNRAEAIIRLVLEGKYESAKLGEALEDLNYLREYRYDTRNTTYKVVKAEDFATTDELLKFCLEERRRELSFEDHRWFDLRRCGMPELKHTITLSENSPQEYTLSQGDKRYTLQIPKAVIDRNYKLEQNPR